MRWPIGAALVITFAVTIGLIAVRPDPLPVGIAVMMALAGPLCCALVFCVLPIPPTSAAQLWPLGTGTATATYMCVRGRTGAAWINVLAMIAVTAIWSASTGQGFLHGVGISVINLGPLLMATFFAYTIRPAARAIFDLREESTRRIATEAAATAALVERDEQMQQLDQLVRPILSTIANPEQLDSTTKLECALLEAHLRDKLRAPALDQPSVAAAARQARQRGVEVVMVDDHGLDDDDDEIGPRLFSLVSTELGRAEAGTVTIRILPPHRQLLATILAYDPATGIRRLEIDHNVAPTFPVTQQIS
ncbi:hypothetical protein [Antrihabitans stalactiti]|uniref:Histidine kinase n=1 Tax=Antrihabitans stalactiti TaxID=2584121 RepID=A0A848KD42_9NOCA|nr:hypothetical protein [Antrihabitans stalactiti]NMN95084.1 hypothetical protein [Antrihabitans stalactiti]